MSYRSALVVVSLLLSVTLGFLTQGATAHSKQPVKRGPLIGFSLDTLKEARWQVDRDVLTARARELGAEVLVQSANGDDSRQVSDCEALISRGIDVLVIVPHDGKAMAKVAEIAERAGVPVIAYDRLISGPFVDLYVTFDNVRVGELQAQYLLNTLKPTAEAPARIVRIYGASSDHNAVMFKQGQDNVLGPAIARGEVVVVHEDWADEWKPENGKRITNAALTVHGKDISAVLASNDGTAGGAVQALLEEGLAGRVLVTGQDADLVATQRIAAGTQAMSIYKPIRTLARGAAELAVRLAKRVPVIARGEVDNGSVSVPSVLFDVVTVTRANLVDSVIADGFHSYDQVFAGMAESQRPPRHAP